MSCDVCNGVGQCPVCTPSEQKIECSKCNGYGYIYYLGEEIVFFEEHAKNKSTEVGFKYKEICSNCKGEGFYGK